MKTTDKVMIIGDPDHKMISSGECIISFGSGLDLGPVVWLKRRLLNTPMEELEKILALPEGEKIYPIDEYGNDLLWEAYIGMVKEAIERKKQFSPYFVVCYD